MEVYQIKKECSLLISDTSPNPAPRARPLPAEGRPKPNLKLAKPRATALYDYKAGDTDEISLFEGEIIEISREGKFDHFTVVSIGLFCSQIVRFCTMEYVSLS